MIRGITFSKQSVSSNDDSHVYNVLLNGRKGKTKGCKMTFGTDDIYISSGYFFAAGRLVQVSSSETVSTPTVSSGTIYCRLVFEIDMTKTNANNAFNQGAFKVLTNASDYPAITQEDLETGGSIYQLPFARFAKSVSGIGSFVSELEAVGHVEGDATVYVSTSGNDASGDGSESYPFKTIKRAVDSLPKNIGGRTITINVAGGTYAEDVVVEGFSGAPLRLTFGAVTLNTLTIYDSCVIASGTSLTLAANGKQYGLHAHRGANVICQLPTTINGAVNGLFVGYGSRFAGRNALTINSCTYAATASYAAQLYVISLDGSKNNNGVTASAGIASIGSINSAMASTLYATSAGGRIYTGAQASAGAY